ncbi:DNA polymerase III subunit beta [Mycoplasma sp. 'Moose RK']|uniref:DNA polymerase III subunit beta n=1 Tax=Mycoplasma sp. 'Moose RK' TaxID=2780095 RepID=UPI0018C306B2|nr:DNA polymerase III subunit beta [Mycoplasma sp. 'Moose RK']MBG0730518.1 DNA polymerase III subunit beta [Mycoplasma sp. 'Moose RK']
MKFTIAKNVIERQIERMQTAILNHNNSPLSSFFMKLTRGGLFIISTNSELSYKVFITIDEIIEINEVGICLIDGFFLRDVIRKSESKITFEIKGNELIVSWENAVFSKGLRDYSIFPEINFEQTGTKLKINTKDFKKAVKNTAFATTNNPSQPVLAAINLSSADNFLFFSATDTNRFASEKIKFYDFAQINISVNAKNLKDFIPPELDQDIELNVDETKISYIYEGLTIQSKILSVPYKDISNILPKSNEILYTFSINKREIIELIDKATIITPGKDNVINLLMSKKYLKAVISHHESGKSNVLTTKVIDFQINPEFANSNDFSSDQAEININYRYLKDAISVFDNEICIQINTKMTKIVVSSKEKPETRQLVGLILI